MKKIMLFFFVVCSSLVYGQHFKLSHATMRSWTSQSDQNQRGVEYRITIESLKKIKNLTFARAWVYDKCFLIESITINNHSCSSSNQTIAKGATIKLFLNIKEVKDDSGTWKLNSDDCKGASPLAPNEGKIKIDYNINGTPCTLIIKDVEMLEQIQFD